MLLTLYEVPTYVCTCEAEGVSDMSTGTYCPGPSPPPVVLVITDHLATASQRITELHARGPTSLGMPASHDDVTQYIGPQPRHASVGSSSSAAAGSDAPLARSPKPRPMSSEPPDEDAPNTSGAQGRHVVDVEESGDLVLDVTFETSRAVLNKSRSPLTSAGRPPKLRPPAPRPSTKVAYRVSIAALKGTSRYFAHLFSNPHFSEARLVADTHHGLVARRIKPSDADARDLPFVALVDDDEATQAADREPVFEDMLRILHRKPIKTAKVAMPFAVTLAIIADRFDCVDAVARELNVQHKFKWPVISSRPLAVDDRRRMADVEQTMRQKVLVSWLLGQPMRLQQASRELILRGSSLWSAFHEADASVGRTAAWWDLPQGLERESNSRFSRRSTDGC